jgi:hypothetical protein
VDHWAAGFVLGHAGYTAMFLASAALTVPSGVAFLLLFRDTAGFATFHGRPDTGRWRGSPGPRASLF